MQKEMVTELCSRMKDDCSNRIVDATLQIASKCHLNADQTADVTVVVSEMTRDIVKRSLDLAIELCRHESQISEEAEA